MQVLAIIPQVADLPALDGLEELGRIARPAGVFVLPLAGRVSCQDVDDALRSRRWDVVLWIGHGRAGELLLSDGDSVRPPWLASQMRGRVGLAVLSVCESGARPAGGQGLIAGFVDALPAAGVSLVAMATAVEDRAAMAFDVALIQALAAGAPAWQAHQAALSAVSGSAMVQAPQFFQGVVVNDFRDSGGQPPDLTRLVYDLVARQAGVEAKVAGLAEDMHEVREELREMRADVKALSPGRPHVVIPRELFLLAMTGALVTLAALIFVAWRVM